jgi:RNA polymerase sigma-70 factor (ECF subfamily)
MLGTLAGDAAAYRTLLTELRLHLRSYFRRRLGNEADAEDLVQETLIAVHEKRETYDSGRPFTVWVHAIARYKLLDHFRRRRIRATLPIEAADALFDGEEPDSARVDVERLLDTLPERSRALIRKVALEGHTVAETATAAGLTESAVKVGIHRSVRRLALRVQGKVRP